MSIDAMKMALEALEGLRDLFYQDTIEALRAAIEAAERQEPIFIVFDGPPSHESGRFVEVETASGKSISAGEWNKVSGFWNLGPFYTTQQPAIPDGMVLVPMNRYSEIIRCLEDIAMGKGGWAWEDVLDEHKAMLSSAPEVPK